jgi:hypothetical protein
VRYGKKFFATLTLDGGGGGRKNKKKCYCFKKVTLKILKIFRKINRGGAGIFSKIVKKTKKFH